MQSMSDRFRTTARVSPSAELGIEAVLARSARTFTRHFHDQFGIGVVLSGAQRSASGRGPVEAFRGDVITVNPGEVHDGAPIDGEPRTWAMLYFDPDRVAEIALDLSEGRSADLELADPVRSDSQAAMLLLAAFRSISRRDRQELRAEFTTELLVRLVERLAVRRVAPVHTRCGPSGVRLARQSVDDDPTGRHSLHALASIAGIGRFALIRAFAAETGLTPHAYVTQRRLQAARRMLKSGLSPAQASIDAGFCDQSHLTRLFSRSYGITPGAYARARG